MIAILALIALVFPELMYAALPPYPVDCLGVQTLPGCGPASNILVTSTIPSLIRLFMRVLGAGGVILIVWGGFQMIMSLGDESKITKGKWGIIYALGGLTLAILSEVIVTFVVTETYVGGPASDLVVSGIFPSALRILLSVLNAVFGLVIVFAGIRMVMSRGKTEEFSKGKAIIQWAILGAIIANISKALIWGITTFWGV